MLNLELFTYNELYTNLTSKCYFLTFASLVFLLGSWPQNGASERPMERIHLKAH